MRLSHHLLALLLQHGIDASGNMSDGPKGKGATDDSFSTFFSETSTNKHVPRA
jgi:hypothetical protein